MNPRVVTMALLMLAGTMTTASAAEGANLVGQPAPRLDAPGVEVVAGDDVPTSRPMTLLFAKPDDTHTREAIEVLADLQARHAHLVEESTTTLVMSRLGGGEAKPLESTTPPTWRVLHDTRDALYTAYHIIATPTVVVVDGGGRVVGFHPGFNTGLAGAVRRDLIVAIDGPEALNAPTPTPGIMNVQMARSLARRRLWERSLEYWRKARAAEQLPCAIALEEVEVLLELRDRAAALELLDAMPDAADCAPRVAELRARAQALASGTTPTETPKPPKVP